MRTNAPTMTTARKTRKADDPSASAASSGDPGVRAAVAATVSDQYAAPSRCRKSPAVKPTNTLPYAPPCDREKPGFTGGTAWMTAATPTAAHATAAGRVKGRPAAAQREATTAPPAAATMSRAVSRPSTVDGSVCGGRHMLFVSSERRYTYANRKDRKKKASAAIHSREPANRLRAWTSSVFGRAIAMSSVSCRRGGNGRRDHRRGVGVAVLVRAREHRRDALEVVDRHRGRQLPLERARRPRVGLRRVAGDHERVREV